MLKLTPAAAILSLHSSALAGIVYSNLATPVGTTVEIVPAGAAAGPEVGNQVTFESPSQQRSVLGVDVYLSIGGSGAAEFDVSLRLYSNDGPQGGPGALRWDSGPLHAVINPSGDALYSALVPNVGVDGCTWTIQITGRTGANQAAISLPQHGPPSIGSAVPGYWVHNPGGWTLMGSGLPFAAEIRTNGVCAPDFNCDGEVGTDADIEAFFACLVGTCPPPPCDSEAPEGEYPDIEAFFRVLAGNPC
jgi:hypothetical protein